MADWKDIALADSARLIVTVTAERDALREALEKMLGEASRRYETTPSGRAHYTKAYAAEIAALKGDPANG